MNLSHLDAGTRYWKQRTQWDRDFHQGLYRRLARKRESGVALFLDSDMVHLLRDWKATRGVSNAFVQERGAEYWPNVVQLYKSLLVIGEEAIPDFGAVTWQQVAPLFYEVAKIKGVASPVFASKLCHFLLPSL